LTGLQIKEQTIILVEFSTTDYNKKLKVTSSEDYLKDAEKYLSSIKKIKNQILTIHVISYHGKCYINEKL